MIEFKAGDKVVFDMQAMRVAECKHFEHLADRVFSVVRVCDDIGAGVVVQICDQEMSPTAVAAGLLKHTAELPPPETALQTERGENLDRLGRLYGESERPIGCSDEEYRKLLVRKHLAISDSVAEKPPKTAQEWMNRHGLKVGDEVRVVRADREWESWVSEMDDFVGKIVMVDGTSHCGEFLRIKNPNRRRSMFTHFVFRPCSLEPVEKASESVKMLDELLKRNTESIFNLPPGADIEIVRGNLKPDSPPVICDDAPSPAQRQEYLDEFAKWKETVKVGDWFEVMRVPVDGEGGWKDPHPGEVFGQFVVGEKVQVRTFFESSGNVLVDFSDNETLEQCEFPFFVLRPCAKPESYNVAYPTLKEFLG
jgi:hypothetical protein